MSDLQTEETRLGAAFHLFNLTQFLGALNDNVYKLLIVFFLVEIRGVAAAADVAALAGIVFVIPFILLSPVAGQLADRFSKQRIILASKVAELLIMSAGAYAFVLGNQLVLYATLFFMAVQSTIFGPAKYGILPEIVDREKLSRANGALEGVTYLAIILGTAFAGILPLLTNGSYTHIGWICTLIAMAGILTARKIPVTPAYRRPLKNPYMDLLDALREIGKDKYLALAIIGSAGFSFIGAYTQLNLIPFGIENHGLTQEQSGLLFLLAAFGICAGAYIAGQLSDRNIELGIAPVGILLISIAMFVLGSAPDSVKTTGFFVGLLGLGGGLFVVPLYAFIQFRSPREHRGRILAASGVISWTAILSAALIVWSLTNVFHASAASGFLVVGGVTLAIAVATLKILPDFLLRFLVLVLMRLIYRVKPVNRQHIPSEGPALLVANHVSWIDALLLVATQQRRIRFLMERSIYNNRLLRPFFRIMKVIPISSEDPRKQLIASINAARKALDDGYLVCIFAEGAVSRNGMLREFRPGFESILRKSDYPVVPVYIGGAWGSIFSYAHGRLLSRLPLSFPYRVQVHFGKPLAASSSAYEVKLAVMELGAEWFSARKPYRKALETEFLKTARQSWSLKAMTDSSGKTLSYGQTASAVVLLAAKLRSLARGQERIGILLPASTAAALANLAVMLLGKTTVNLNFTASAETLAYILQDSGLETVIASRKFIEKSGLEIKAKRLVFLEDLLSEIPTREKVMAWLRARLLPLRMIAERSGFSADDPATILYSSGSTGRPKGVVLSHHNIISNVEGLRMVFRTGPEDNVCAALPFFHAFGYTGTFWLPLLSGFSAAYHPSPLEPGQVAKLARRNNSTILLTTPTFLQSYTRKACREDFASLRLVVTGGERLPERVSAAFEGKFGFLPLQGYGTTELSPVAALSLPDVTIGGVTHPGNKPGSVGVPLPGVSVHVVDPDTGEERPPGEEGLVEIGGPGVMLGYLNLPELSNAALSKGRYKTGDIGKVGRDGFLTITDRLSRFSKIGGEMVPHGVVEDALQEVVGTVEQAVAVTAVADAKKGEKLVVFCTGKAGDPDLLYQQLQQSNLPNLFQPARNCYFQVASLPLLGSGKLDLSKLKTMAGEVMASASVE